MLQPLPLTGVQGQGVELGERLDQGERQALRALSRRAKAYQPKAQYSSHPWRYPRFPHTPLLCHCVAQPLII
ncbi:hypothetical protein D9M71_213700 [compost metagenome]